MVETSMPKKPAIIVALFGVTDGLEVCAFPPEDVGPAKDWIEVNPTEVTLSADVDTYLIQRRTHLGSSITWIGVYRQVYEKKGARPGNYYGAGLWLLKRSVPDSSGAGEVILSVLRDLCGLVERLAVQDGSFVRSLSEVREHVKLKHVTDKLNKIVTLLQPPEQDCVDEAKGYIDASGLSQEGLTLAYLIDWALDDGPLFGEYHRAMIALHAGAYASGARVSAPMRPYELRQGKGPRQTQARKMRAAARSAPVSKPPSARVTTYEDRAEERIQEEMVAARTVQRLGYEDVGKENIYLYSDSVIATPRAPQKAAAADVPWKSILGALYFCGAVLVLILFTMLALSARS